MELMERRAVRKAAWVTMTVLALLIAVYGLAALVVPGFGPPFMAERRTQVAWAVYAHLSGSLWALATGPWQLSDRLRQRSLGWHRWLGRSYVLGVLVGGVGGLGLAPHAETGLVAGVGFGTLGVLWLAFTALAFVRIRSGDLAAHRRWMVRSYALTLAAVTLRIYLPLGALAGVGFEAAYPAIAWLCWVPNLVVAELWFVHRERSAPAVARS
mgnify:CR=1 FL=1